MAEIPSDIEALFEPQPELQQPQLGLIPETEAEPAISTAEATGLDTSPAREEQLSPLPGRDVPPGEPRAITLPEDIEALFEEPRRLSGTLSEQAIAAGQGLATGTIRGATVAGGAKAGVIVTAPIPIPGARVVGAIAGAIGGYFLGDELVDLGADPDIVGDTPLTFRSLEDVPEHLRASAAFGETFGSFVGPTGVIVHAAKGGARIIISPTAGRLRTFSGNMINRMMEEAATRTGRFVATEAAATGTAALAGAAAVETFPGSSGARLTSELVGGLFSPTRLILGLGSDATKAAFNMGKRLTPSARRSKMGQELQKYIRAAEGDPASMAMALRTLNLPDGVRPTLAGALGDPAAAAFEAELRELSREFGVQAATATRNALESLASAVMIFRDIGTRSANPFALREAARLRNQAYRTILEARVQRVTDTALEKVGRITQDTPKMRADLSDQAATALDASLKAARKVERQLYGKVKDIDSEPTGVLRRWQRVKTEMLRRDRLPEIVESTLEDIQNAKKLVDNLAENGLSPEAAIALARRSRRRNIPKAERESLIARLARLKVSEEQIAQAVTQLSTKNLRLFRSKALELARQADKDGNDSLARHLGQLAESALQDMDTAYQRAIETGELPEALADVYTQARGFSFQLHEVYTRAFGGITRELGRRGQVLVPPETLLRRALATGPEMRAKQFEELEQATRFLPNMADEGVEISEAALKETRFNIDMMLDAQQRFIRLAAADVIGDDGFVNPALVTKFLKNNAELLENFSSVREIMEATRVSEEARRAVENVTRQRLARVAQNNAFAKILKTESPADAIANALASPQPARQFTAMFELARKSGPDAVAGFRAATWDHLARAAQRSDGVGISLPKFIELADAPIRPGLPSVLELAAQQGWMSPGEIGQVRQILDVARNIILTQATSPTGEMIFGGGLEDITGAGMDVLLRLAGAKGARIAAGTLGQQSTGESLIVSYSGARLMRHVFQRLPRLKLTQIAVAAMRGDPITPGGEPYSLAETLLTTPENPKNAIRLAQQLHTYAQAALLSYAASFTNEPLPSAEDLQQQEQIEQLFVPINQRNQAESSTPSTGFALPEGAFESPVPGETLAPDIQEGDPAIATGTTSATPPNVTAIAEGSATPGELSNNPGNLRITKTAWEGKVKGVREDFETFATPGDGIRAAARNLLTLQRRDKLQTIRQLITAWAPATENPTTAYVKNVADGVGVEADTPIDLENVRTLTAMVRAIIHQENGRNIYDDELLSENVAAAL